LETNVDCHEGFRDWCSLPSIHGAIDGTNVAILKPFRHFVNDSYYHKSGGYNVVAQVVMDCNK
jgi:hypothetical protein